MDLVSGVVTDDGSWRRRIAREDVEIVKRSVVVGLYRVRGGELALFSLVADGWYASVLACIGVQESLRFMYVASCVTVML